MIPSIALRFGTSPSAAASTPVKVSPAASQQVTPKSSMSGLGGVQKKDVTDTFQATQSSFVPSSSQPLIPPDASVNPELSVVSHKKYAELTKEADELTTRLGEPDLDFFKNLGVDLSAFNNSLDGIIGGSNQLLETGKLSEEALSSQRQGLEEFGEMPVQNIASLGVYRENAPDVAGSKDNLDLISHQLQANPYMRTVAQAYQKPSHEQQVDEIYKTAKHLINHETQNLSKAEKLENAVKQRVEQVVVQAKKAGHPKPSQEEKDSLIKNVLTKIYEEGKNDGIYKFYI